MSTVNIRPIERADEKEWRGLFQGYCEHYKLSLDPKVRDQTWERFFDPDVSMYAAVAVSQGRLIGLVHWITHLSTLSKQDFVYLHDLYVDPASRCHGVGRKLIETVYKAGDDISAGRIYWHTQADNHAAQLLYTKVGFRNGFICYQRPL